MTLKNISYSNGTTDGHRLINVHDVWTILSSVVTFSLSFFIKKSFGIVPLSIKYFFRRFPITRPSWIQTFTISKKVSAAVVFDIWNLSAKSMTDTPSRSLIRQRINFSKDSNLFPLLISLLTRLNNVIRVLKHANPV